jgi:hypothetical protein
VEGERTRPQKNYKEEFDTTKVHRSGRPERFALSRLPPGEVDAFLRPVIRGSETQCNPLAIVLCQEGREAIRRRSGWPRGKWPWIKEEPLQLIRQLTNLFLAVLCANVKGDTLAVQSYGLDGLLIGSDAASQEEAERVAALYRNPILLQEREQVRGLGHAESSIGDLTFDRWKQTRTKAQFSRSGWPGTGPVPAAQTETGPTFSSLPAILPTPSAVSLPPASFSTFPPTQNPPSGSPSVWNAASGQYQPAPAIPSLGGGVQTNTWLPKGWGRKGGRNKGRFRAGNQAGGFGGGRGAWRGGRGGFQQFQPFRGGAAVPLHLLPLPTAAK